MPGHAPVLAHLELAATQALPKGIEGRLTAGGGIDQVVVVTGDEGLQRVAHPAEHAVVGPFDPPVHGEHRDAHHPLHRLGGAALHPVVAAGFGDVQQHAVQPRRPTFAWMGDLAGEPDPALGVAAVQQPELGRHRAALRHAGCQDQRLLDALAVGGMDQVGDGAPSRGEVRGGPAGQRVHAGAGEQHGVRLVQQRAEGNAGNVVDQRAVAALALADGFFLGMLGTDVGQRDDAARLAALGIGAEAGARQSQGQRAPSFQRTQGAAFAWAGGAVGRISQPLGEVGIRCVEQGRERLAPGLIRPQFQQAQRRGIGGGDAVFGIEHDQAVRRLLEALAQGVERRRLFAYLPDAAHADVEQRQGAEAEPLLGPGQAIPVGEHRRRHRAGQGADGRHDSGDGRRGQSPERQLPGRRCRGAGGRAQQRVGEQHGERGGSQQHTHEAEWRGASADEDRRARQTHHGRDAGTPAVGASPTRDQRGNQRRGWQQWPAPG